jgi:hypothetical protein
LWYERLDGSHKGCRYIIHGCVFVVAALVAAIFTQNLPNKENAALQKLCKAA